ncbi:hypothetical protein RU639_006649 [Aspergillus parasiticus]
MVLRDDPTPTYEADGKSIERNASSKLLRRGWLRETYGTMGLTSVATLLQLYGVVGFSAYPKIQVYIT